MDGLRNKGRSTLRYLERYTKTDMIYLAQGGFWLGLGQIVATGSAFLISIAFANLLDPEIYGIYKYILSINALILVTTLTGMDSAITQAVSRGFDGTLDPGIKTKIKWGTLGTLGSVLIALYYFFQGNMVLAISFCIVAIFAPFTESMDMYNSLLWGKKKFDVQTKYNIVKKTIILICLISTIFLTKNLYIIIFMYFLSMTIPSIYFLYRSKKIYKSNDSIDPQAIQYGKKLSAINIITLIMGELDKILVFQYVGATNLAIYTLAIAPTDQIKGLLKNVNSLAMPQFAKRQPDDIRKMILHKIWILGAGTGAVIAIYILFAPFLFKIFFPKYLASIIYSQILSISLIGAVLSAFLYTILESQKATKEIYNFNIYSNVVSIVFLFPLVYFFGIWGAIISRLIIRFLVFIYSIFLVRRMS